MKKYQSKLITHAVLNVFLEKVTSIDLESTSKSALRMSNKLEASPTELASMSAKPRDSPVNGSRTI